MAVQEKLYTADDLWELSHLPENSEKRLELSEGVLIEMSPAGGKHGSTAFYLGWLFGNFVIPNGLGELTAAETGYILHAPPDGKPTVRAPDVGFVRHERVPEGGLPAKYIPFAPDLAVEVMSPTDTPAEIEQKIDEYLRYGTRMVIVIYTDAQTIYVHTPGQTLRLRINDVFDGGDVLPGFTLPVREVFERRPRQL